ncbi:GtrA family protein [Plantactinospora sp. KLBMP9567]|uniref:GtrA family protein n=1 Tax=Plantactinospora sp. KLBMP9567 TaxID=3085900 RepID=UPI00298205CD|nr:GtrA family protein [Plantactinospora sp. KLBMP9567]MDW5326338.1 GtrA family protein [Plantactinospora sp. KLBMP9567]
MRFARLLPERWQRFLREVLKFGAVGGVNAAINYAVFNALALTVFADGQLKANVVATVVATISSYLMNRHWTYRDRPKSAMRREYALFFLFNGAGLVIELGVLALAKYGFGISGLLALNLAKTVGVGLATVFRFWSYRTFVFRKSPSTVLRKSPSTPSVPTAPGVVGKTTGLHPAGEPDGEFLAELDPVAELAGAVSELTEPETAGAAPATTGTRADTGSPVGSAQPLEVQFAETIDAALETELAAELNAAPRRSSAR